MSRALDAARATDAALAGVDEVLPRLDALYRELHAAPELSFAEERTAARLAAELRALGLAVTERVGGHGVVGVLANGPGPTVLLRTDMDALPVEERTGLPFASRAAGRDDGGRTVPLMHACGHDLHMAAWTGAATLLAAARGAWRGTLLLAAQPAEERASGAAAMIADGLLTRFGRPAAALALHVTPELAAGRVGWVSGAALASVDALDVTFFGRGGHGAYPHRTVDPIVMASRFVLGVQAVVAREIDPLDAAVVTVGAFHAGTKHNVIPDEARLMLTVRAHREETRARLLAAIERTAHGEAEAAAAPRPPQVARSESIPVTRNDPALVARLVPALVARLGPARVEERPPVMGGEDFAELGRAGVPAALFWIGAADPAALADAERRGEALPSLHSGLFAPAPGALRTAVEALVAMAGELLAPAPGAGAG